MEGVDLAEWNASHSKRWNHFMTALRREVGEVQYWRGVEVQEESRGALHDHALVISSGHVDERMVRRLAIRAGFGHEVKVKRIRAGSMKEAHYCAKYVTKACDVRGSVPWRRLDLETGEITDGDGGRYRTWSMSRQYGLTMAIIEWQAAEYARQCRVVEESASLGLEQDPWEPPPGAWQPLAGGSG